MAWWSNSWFFYILKARNDKGLRTTGRCWRTSKVRARRNYYWKIEIKSSKKKRKAGAGLKILAPNKLLTRLPMSLEQIKAGNNSYNQTNTVSFVSAQ